MGRGEAPRPGATARRFRFTSARTAPAGLGHRRRPSARLGPGRPVPPRRTPRHTAHVRIAPALLALALTLPTGALATACGNHRTTGVPSAAATEAAPPPPTPASASPRQALSPTELCTTAVRYWARRTLDGATPYGDYQSMGLSNRQYGILREVVDAARTAQRARGSGAAQTLIDRQAQARCTEQYRDGGPTDGPWQ
ncbi:hypothetical protein [Streptomyces sp. M92]|uniref:hypothetical protein n=1 Tax=Streptomyces sp. M92 TaxID=2944250 RepID=UPI00234A5E3D|nr:hypothetical protein [Streptomyces sp. M92]WCN00781.1 hypothetical protein M6G08_01145 [Streptomyces sp. M92]